MTIADSRDFSKGIRAFADWEAAVAGGLPCVKAVTVPLTAGPVVLGFVCIWLEAFGSKADRDGLASLREISDNIGGAIFVRRAFALNQGSTRAPEAVARAPSDAPPVPVSSVDAQRARRTAPSVPRSSSSSLGTVTFRRTLSEVEGASGQTSGGGRRARVSSTDGGARGSAYSSLNLMMTRKRQTGVGGFAFRWRLFPLRLPDLKR